MSCCCRSPGRLFHTSILTVRWSAVGGTISGCMMYFAASCAFKPYKPAQEVMAASTVPSVNAMYISPIGRKATSNPTLATRSAMEPPHIRRITFCISSIVLMGTVEITPPPPPLSM